MTARRARDPNQGAESIIDQPTTSRLGQFNYGRRDALESVRSSTHSGDETQALDRWLFGCGSSRDHRGLAGLLQLLTADRTWADSLDRAGPSGDLDYKTFPQGPVQ